ncbi:hypothetical protein B0A55_02126 [Friedmanniomyces simplex]|uniref:Uncharacterized protein n=1 Tax=Friedmanniomyces simplex TaxID=329884 RepID=A0A4U0XNA3_9PEZI|nr:hypothetical protein B0A55_02126 [Friedmanniomyces simplex]
MPTYEYKTALSVLTETEKNRVVCLYLSSDTAILNASIDWEKATMAFGSASVSSLRVSLNNSLKKIADQGGKGGKAGEDPGPAKAKSGGGKKRKGDVGEEVDDEEPVRRSVVVAGRRRDWARRAGEEKAGVEDDDA